jgi:hypothetical protein
VSLHESQGRNETNREPFPILGRSFCEALSTAKSIKGHEGTQRSSVSVQPLSFQNSPSKPILANAASTSATVFGRQSGLKRSSYHSLAKRHP